ncbi:unnamed protein product [Lymnaea stagnalis]|uniref:Sterile alpha motif domain-containing protein 9-like n=1 Tax=Lymnaea stagnalis TaxID=6523 RepID=A0AAV2I852_LYMST
MNPSELKQFLIPEFESQGFDKKILEDLERESISGKVFMTMKEEDFKETIPSANFGVRRLLKMVIEQCTKTVESKPMPEHLCKFDSIVGPTDKYVKGHCADVNSYLRGKTTTPVRNFHLVKDDDKEVELDDMSMKVVTFASACLNDRRNGTIYFGISPSTGDGHKTGEIVGVSHPQEVVQDRINAYLTSAFSSVQKNVISGTIRNARFVPVIDDDFPKTDVFVVEVDVLPNSSMMAEETIRTKLKHLTEYNKKDSKSAVFRFSDEGYPAIVSPDEMTNYERDKSRIIQQRKQDEKNSIVEPTPDLRVRLRNLLTGGTEKFEDTSYIFLMTSPIDSHMDQAYLLKNASFIKNLRPEVVFDFDPKGSTDGIYNNLDSQQEEKMRVLVIPNNFEKEGKKHEEYTNFLDGLANESKISWIFCNGYTEMSIDPMTPTDWNRKRRSAFQDGLKFYIENFNKDRIIFMICLFSKNYSAMIEACDEVVTKLPENWLLIAETESVAKLWQDQILARNRVEKKDLLDRCVIGMPWEQINTTINQTLREPESHECYLPCSTGALIEVREKKLKDWCDIDVLSAGEFKIPEAGKEKRKKDMEENFYKGEQVDWLNFFFHDQVLKRDIHQEFKKLVIEAVQGRGKDEEDKVTTVAILHQPGAGGTTSSKQVLWDLRKEYRCCVVNTITDQTADQLDEIRCFGDSNPKPLLILIDDEDEEKYNQIAAKLEEKGRRRWRDQQESFNVYCTIILCTRRTSLPKQLKSRQISLRQELNINELDWFKKKSETLKSRFERNKDNNVNPKFLISFNILKENFNKDYVSKVVKEFSDDVKSPKEVKLLKVVSLLNSFDPDFKPIRVSCLDKILENQQNHRVMPQHPGNLKRNVGWEANLSQGVKVLLNLSSNRNQAGKARKCLRVFNKVIAQEIFKKMKERTGQKESEIMLELIESGLYEEPTYDAKHFQGIINSVMKKREYNSDGRKHKFSQFVLYVQQNEGAEVALMLLENLFEMTKDPFTAQQISRFYIELKNWSRAEFYAKRATSLLPGNSFLWDTHGQVFKNQLYDKLASQKTLERAEGFNPSEIHKLIELTESCINCFRKAQKISEDEFTTGGENNFAGYFGELRAIVILLSALKLCPAFNKDDMLHRYLVDQQYKLSCFDEHDSDYLKNLEKFATEAMRRLDEEYLQMKGNINLDIVAPKFDFDRKSLLDLKVNLDDYFGEPNDATPRNLCESDACEYRLRRARKLGGTSLNLLLRMRQDGQLSSLVQIYNLLIENVNSRINFDDLRSILDTVTVYLLDYSPPPGLEYEQILKWCKKLYSLNSTNISARSYLEIYLYYVLYNFPTDERQGFELCMPLDLVNAIHNWHLAFIKNYPKCTREEIRLKRRETTLFFLGNGKPLQDIVHQDSLEVMSDFSLQEKWQLQDVRAKLRLQMGILVHGGEKINMSIITKEGNRFELIIPTSHRVTKRDMWQKRVYFYIGFSFSGPRAFGMTLNESVQSVPHPMHVKPAVFVPSKKQPPPTLLQLFRDLKYTEAEIEKNKNNPKAKAILLRKHEEISAAMKKLVGE